MSDQEPTEAETVEPTTEAETVEPTTETESVGGVILDPMTEKEAKRITECIRLNLDNAMNAMEKLPGLIEQAKKGSADTVLGYPSWTAYLASIYSERPLRLPQETRREVVSFLSGEGMSTRAIAAVAGVDQKTVVNDLRATGEEISSPGPEGGPAPEKGTERTGEDSSSPARIEASAIETDQISPDANLSAVVRTEGLDGRTYSRHRPEPTPEQKFQLRVEERQRAAARTRRNGVKGATALRHCSRKDLASTDAATLGADADTFREAATWLDKAAAKAQTPGEDEPDEES